MILNGNQKYCPDCRQELPINAFTNNKRSRDGLAFYCAPCARQRHLASRRARNGPPRSRNGQGPKNVPEGRKWCPECKLVKNVEEFPRNKAQKNGLGAYCKPCHNVIVAANRARHGGPRNYHLRRRYGITAEHADQMLIDQNGKCAICLEAPAVHIDHDHSTGKVRGMLCFNCNGALGQFRDRTDLMALAQVYLSAGAGAVPQIAPFDFDVSTGSHESPRPKGEDNSYLFEFLDEVEPV